MFNNNNFFHVEILFYTIIQDDVIQRKAGAIGVGKEKNTINSKRVEISRSPWQEVGATHA